jgi:hypothetical protein
MADSGINKDRGMKRPKRVPVGVRNILTAPKREGYVRRFVNDTPGRISQFEAAGYTTVKESVNVGDPSAGKSKHPGAITSVPAGSGVNAVLMEIRKDLYDEDQARKQAQIKMSENDITREGQHPGGLTGRVQIE